MNYTTLDPKDAPGMGSGGGREDRSEELTPDVPSEDFTEAPSEEDSIDSEDESSEDETAEDE